MTTEPSRGPRARGGARPGAGRPRVAGFDDAILAATADLLQRKTYAEFTVEAVAARAGVAVGTVYRRWPSKASLAAAAYLDVLGQDEPVDTGSLRGDLTEVAHDVLRLFTGVHGRMLLTLLTAAGGDQQLMQAIRRSTRTRRKTLRAALQRAIARGEIAEWTDIDLAMDLFVGPLWTRLLVTGERITPPMVAGVVELTVRALGAAPA
ncbi:MAG TPA: TetR-like C-terminal domain-containing protein [Mycobacteriales bacterium]|nr:TetR-like C-terminal domain-containing protein [Mycobacteriales bacterium]